ncbi:hypothetical protein AAE478_003665 [Parahypoxylon ruwenzoriense]
MTTEAPSPKRRHILSSINREPHPASPEMGNNHIFPDAPPCEPTFDVEEAAAAATPEAKEGKATKFRFKSKSSRSRPSSRHHDNELDNGHDRDREDQGEDPSSSERRRHQHHQHHQHYRHHYHHHHRPQRHKRRRSRSETPPNPYDPPPLDPDAAFREALFDAMADDEGAAYWENVYGQPMHVYGRDREGGGGGGAGKGELEQMDDEEYAAYVRQKMWEKTHEGLLEERARREEQRRRQEDERREATRLTREMERSLRRGEERRKRRGWKERWEEYIAAWGAWDGAPEGVPWPVRSGRPEDVLADPAVVLDFYVMGIDPEEVGEAEFLAKLKEERVRWHPDKMQQKLGGKVDEAVARNVTAVFQIVDKLWSDTRSREQ